MSTNIIKFFSDVIELLRIKKEHSWKRKSKEDPVAFATKKWEKLSDNQKKSLIQELKEINEEYIDNFGKFLQVRFIHIVLDIFHTYVFILLNCVRFGFSNARPIELPNT